MCLNKDSLAARSPVFTN